jgi:hypothetical protein
LFSVCVSYMLLNFELIGLRYLTETIVQVYFRAGMEQTCFLNRSYENCASICNFSLAGRGSKCVNKYLKSGGINQCK